MKCVITGYGSCSSGESLVLLSLVFVKLYRTHDLDDVSVIRLEITVVIYYLLFVIKKIVVINGCSEYIKLQVNLCISNRFRTPTEYICNAYGIHM